MEMQETLKTHERKSELFHSMKKKRGVWRVIQTEKRKKRGEENNNNNNYPVKKLNHSSFVFKQTIKPSLTKGKLSLLCESRVNDTWMSLLHFLCELLLEKSSFCSASCLSSQRKCLSDLMVDHSECPVVECVKVHLYALG